MKVKVVYTQDSFGVEPDITAEVILSEETCLFCHSDKNVQNRFFEEVEKALIEQQILNPSIGSLKIFKIYSC